MRTVHACSSLCSEPGQVEKFAVTPGAKENTFCEVTVSIMQQQGEEDPEESGSQNAPLFHTTIDRDRVREGTVKEDPGFHV